MHRRLAVCSLMIGCLAATWIQTPARAERRAKPATRPRVSRCRTLPNAVNTAEAALAVNGNLTGPFPIRAYMGEQDPNVVTVNGPANAPFDVFVTDDCGGATGITLLTGVLDEQGHRDVVWEPGTFEAGQTFMLRATVEDPATQEHHLSGATQVRILPSMSSAVDWVMPTGSIARIRGPVMWIKGQQISVGGIIYQANAETDYANIAELADLGPGDWVHVDGEFNGAGGFTAKEIGLEDTEPEARITARVQGIGDAGIVVLGVSIFVNTDTTYFDLETGTWRDFGAIEPGMVVDVYVPLEAPIPDASQIMLNAPTEPEPEPEPEPEDEIEEENEVPAPPFCS